MNDAYACKWVVYVVDFIEWNFIRAQNALIDKFLNVLEIIGSITNVYDRNNVFYVNRVTGESIYQFPILPSMGISYKF